METCTPMGRDELAVSVGKISVGLIFHHMSKVFQNNNQKKKHLKVDK